MSQMLRSALMFARRPWARPATALDVFHTRFRVLPWDCDLNLHLTNTRYPAWLDLARTEFFLRLGTGPLFVRKGWRSVLASQTLTFVRETFQLHAQRYPYTNVCIDILSECSLCPYL